MSTGNREVIGDLGKSSFSVVGIEASRVGSDEVEMGGTRAVVSWEVGREQR